MSLVLPLVVGLGVTSRGAAGRWGGSLGAGVMIGYLVLARCRAAWLGAVVSLVWLGLLRLARRRAQGEGGESSPPSYRRAVATVLLAAALLLAGTYGAGISLASAAPSLRTAELGGWLLRLDVWRAGLSMAWNYPLGAGAGNWSTAFATRAGRLDPPTRFGPARLPSQAGNEYLEIAGELGMAGLVLLLWAAGWLLREGWRRSRLGDGWMVESATAALGGLLASAMMASVLRDQPGLWAVAVLSALVVPPGVPEDRGDGGPVPRPASPARRRTAGAVMLGFFLLLLVLTAWNIGRSLTASRWLRIGKAACAERNYSLALPALARAADDGGALFAAHYLAGACALEARQPELAERELEAARRLNPGDPSTLLALTRSLRVQGKMIEAVGMAEKAARFWPRDEAVNLMLADLREATGNPKGALEAYQLAAEANPSSVQTFMGLGDIFLAQGQGFQAVGAYLRAVNLDPYRPEAVMKLGNAYLKQGDYDGAIQAYQRLLDFQPDHLAAQINLARTYSGLRQHCEARRILDKVLPRIKDPAQHETLEKAVADLTEKCRSGGS